MTTDLVVARLDSASRALAAANTPAELKAVIDAAAAARVYAQRQRLGAEVIAHATAIKLDAERKLGTILAATPKNVGTRTVGGSVSGGATVVPPDDTPTLASLGLDKKTSARAQRLAALSDEAFEAVRSGDVKPTEALRRARNVEKIAAAQALPADVFRVIYADPPWQYNDARGADDHRQTTAASHHYPTMSLDAIKAMAVASIAAKDSVLFCWATFPLLREALEVVEAWGFAYKTAFVWDKGRGTFGHYHDASAELLMVATRGSCTPDSDSRARQVQTFKRMSHSAKPDDWRALHFTSSGAVRVTKAKGFSEGAA